MSVSLPRTRPLYLSLERSDDVGILLRDVELLQSEGPLDKDTQPVHLERLTRITIDLPLDACAQMEVTVLGSNDHPVHVKANVYDLRVAGYALIPPGGRQADSARVLDMLAGREPGLPPTPITPAMARLSAQQLLVWADEAER